MRAALISTVFLLLSSFSAFGDGAREPETKESNHSAFPDDGIFTGSKEVNLLLNPDFENYTSRWTLAKHNGGVGLFTTAYQSDQLKSRCAIVMTENIGKDYTDVQLFTHLELTNQTAYLIAFSAEVYETCLISISISNGFETFYEKRFLLRPQQRYYGPFLFTSDTDDLFSFFAFNLGKTSSTIKIDDVKIQADHTKKEFNDLISKSGINIHLNRGDSTNSIFVSLPTELNEELPLLLYNEDNNVIFASKLRIGHKEATIYLDKPLDQGNYMLKLFTTGKPKTFKLSLN